MNAPFARIKVCGITSADDAHMAVEAGVDALGVVLAPSKREVTIEQAAAALADVPKGVTRIGVFVNAAPEFVADAVRRIGLSVVQFHGDETPEQCAAAPVPVIKAIHATGENAREEFDRALAEYQGSAVGLLVDTYDPDVAGGTGRTFDWEALGSLQDVPVPVFVAGGLNSDNVADAIRALRPYAVDVSSGVEAEPGRKDEDKIREFVAAVRAVNQEVSR